MPDLAIQIEAPDELAPAQLDGVRRRAAELGRLVPEPLAPEPPLGLRLTLRPGPPSGTRRRYVADASLPVGGRPLAAHAIGETPMQATDAVVERLGRQLRRRRDAEVAMRNEPRVIARALEDLVGDEPARPEARIKPAEQRRIVHRRTFAQEPEPTLTAIADLLDDDDEFHLFVHVRTDEDVVVHHRDDGRIGMLIPRGSVLADEGDIVRVQESRYSEPLDLAFARSEMDVLNHRFLYFIDAADMRGKVLYLRFDGDYGLVEPPA